MKTKKQINKFISSTFFFAIFLSLTCFSQFPEIDLYSQVHPYVDVINVPGSQIKCDKAKEPINYNFISNNGFKSNHNINETNPFASGYVPTWVETHGTPALNNFINPLTDPPYGLSNYASMYSWRQNEKNSSEGIAQMIPMIKKGEKYQLSFFKKLADGRNEFDINMDKFFIVLMQCKDYKSIHKYPEYFTPDLPASSQVIYSESVGNRDWMYVNKNFLANDDYDMVWIFPKQRQETQIFFWC